VNLRFKLILLTLLFILPTLGISMGLEVVNVSTPQFNELMKKHPEIMVLDIRTPGEFNQHHVKGAVNIDFLAPDFAAKLNKLDKNQPILMHCRSGNRSGQSLAVFQKLGFKKIYHLNYGIVGGWPQR
jgi:rhodanese-related sulfurtransferase